MSDATRAVPPTSGVVGRRVPRREDVCFLTGAGTYIDDVRLPGALAVSILRSTAAHARIVRVDASAALGSPGVVAVVLDEELQGMAAPFSDANTPFFKQHRWHALAGDRVRYAGEPIAAVVATDAYLAEDALERVDVEYDVLTVVPSIEAAVRPGAPLLYEDWGDNKLVTFSGGSGDVEQALRDADVVFRERYRIQRVTGAPLEPKGAIAWYEGGHLTLWSSTQWSFVVRTVLAGQIGIPESKLRVIAPDIGGGFGSKQHIFREELLICLLAMKLGKPVKWIEDRRESFLAGVHARDQIHDVEVAAAADGRILGLRDRILADMGSGAIHYSGASPAIVTASFVPGPYHLENFAFELSCVVTNTCPTGAYRGFGMTEAAFVMERSIDLVARQLHLDPIDVRRVNLVRADQMPYGTATGCLFDSGDFHATLEQAVTLAGASVFRAEQKAARERGRFIGLGVSFVIEGSGPTMFPALGWGGAYEQARIRVEPDGAVSVFTSTSGQGQGHETTLAQVAADALGVPFEAVTLLAGDTERGVYGLGTWGSRVSVLVAAAVRRAAESLRGKILVIAEHFLEIPADGLTMAGGIIQPKDALEPRLSLMDVVRVAYHEPFRLPPAVDPGLEAVGAFDPPNIDHFPDASGKMNASTTYANAVHIAKVEVDIELGGVQILDYVVVEDCGRMINPMIVEGQITGGVAQGIGAAIYEELRYDENGQLTTAGFMDYLLPTAPDIPQIRIGHLETPATHVPGGFKGMGESGAVGPPAAIAAAIEDALSPFGVTIRSTPVTPSVILKALSGS